MSESDLEKRLHTVLGNFWIAYTAAFDKNDGSIAEETHKTIAQIMAAIKDAGYKKHDKAGCIEFDYDDEQKANMLAIVASKMHFREPVMTGAEWLLAVQRELGAEGRTPDDTITFRELSEAAQRAAGIDER